MSSLHRSSHKILNRILLYLKPEIHKQLAHSILKANGKPTEWNDSLMNLVGNYLVFLPQSELEQYISDDVVREHKLSVFLNTYNIIQKSL